MPGLLAALQRALDSGLWSLVLRQVRDASRQLWHLRRVPGQHFKEQGARGTFCSDACAAGCQAACALQQQRARARAQVPPLHRPPSRCTAWQRELPARPTSASLTPSLKRLAASLCGCVAHEGRSTAIEGLAVQVRGVAMMQQRCVADEERCMRQSYRHGVLCRNTSPVLDPSRASGRSRYRRWSGGCCTCRTPRPTRNAWSSPRFECAHAARRTGRVG